MYDENGLDYERGLQVAGPSLVDLLGYDEEDDDMRVEPEAAPFDVECLQVFP